jgi:hypothetical protein
VTLAIQVAQGASSSPEALRLDVRSNLAAGYTVTVLRTVLSRGDLTVRLAGFPTADPQLVLDLPTTLTILPAGPERAFGHRTGSISDADGDRWRVRVLVGPLGCPSTGLHAGELVFTTRAGARIEVARVALRVNVQRNRRLCG